MTQEDKELLFKDLCTRLPYGVIVKFKSREKKGKAEITCGNIVYVTELGNGWWEECKPYLRPMSSMTKKEKDYSDCKFDAKPYGSIGTWGSGEGGYSEVGIEDMMSYIDWLNSHHFDYRGLIEKGLAIEAPEDMYKID